MDLREPVWLEDLDDQGDVARDSAKVFDTWVQRLHYQHAPQALIDRVKVLRDLAARLNDEIVDVRSYFPKQPK